MSDNEGTYENKNNIFDDDNNFNPEDEYN